MTDPAIDSEKNNSIAPVEAETAWDLYYKIRTINDSEFTEALHERRREKLIAAS
jgi:hypothetical protein